jgi:hypothetical protein
MAIGITWPIILSFDHFFMTLFGNLFLSWTKPDWIRERSIIGVEILFMYPTCAVTRY